MVNPATAATDAARLIGQATITTRLADDIVAAHRVGAGVDASGLAKDLIGRAANDPGEARTLAQQLETHLSPVERGQLAAALDKQAPAVTGMTEAQKGLALDLTQMGIDVVGMFDPTPTTGAINTGISLARHDWWGAALSAISMVPYAGDLARAGKLGKYAKVVVEVAEMAAKDSKFAKEVRPALEAIEAGLKKIPGSVLDMLPKGARNTIEAMKSTIGKALGRTADAVAVLSAKHGSNEVKWTLDAAGRPTRVEATLSQIEAKGAERSAEELKAQDTVRGLGVDGDDAGHVIGQRFMPDEGVKNMFPQNANFNRSAYKTMENEWAAWIEAGGKVKIDVKLVGGTANRPDHVEVVYQVLNDAGKRIYKNAETFDNISGQVFDRVSTADIRALMK